MLVMTKRCDNWAPRGTLPKSWLSPSLNIFSAHADCADVGAAPKATTNNAIRACLRFILSSWKCATGYAGIPQGRSTQILAWHVCRVKSDSCRQPNEPEA